MFYAATPRTAATGWLASAEHSTGAQSSDLTRCERNQLWQGKRWASLGNTERETWFIFPHLPPPCFILPFHPLNPCLPSGVTPGSISEEWKGIIWKKIFHSSEQSHFLDVLEAQRPSQWLSLPMKILWEFPYNIVMRERQGRGGGGVMTVWPSLSWSGSHTACSLTYCLVWVMGFREIYGTVQMSEARLLRIQKYKITNLKMCYFSKVVMTIHIYFCLYSNTTRKYRKFVHNIKKHNILRTKWLLKAKVCI